MKSGRQWHLPDLKKIRSYPNVPDPERHVYTGGSISLSEQRQQLQTPAGESSRSWSSAYCTCSLTKWDAEMGVLESFPSSGAFSHSSLLCLCILPSLSCHSHLLFQVLSGRNFLPLASYGWKQNEPPCRFTPSTEKYLRCTHWRETKPNKRLKLFLQWE